MLNQVPYHEDEYYDHETKIIFI